MQTEKRKPGRKKGYSPKTPELVKSKNRSINLTPRLAEVWDALGVDAIRDLLERAHDEVIAS